MTSLWKEIGRVSIKLTWAGVCSLALLWGISCWTTPIAQAAGESCFATIDAISVYSSTDASAVQTAVDAANPDDTVKIAGICAGVQSIGGAAQSVLVNKDLTLRGGYTTTNWLAAPDPESYPTTLDAQNLGRVVVISGTAQALVEALTMTGGNAAEGGGLYVDTEASLTLSDSLVVSNTATITGGGGLGNLGQAVVLSTTFSYNMAPLAGGVGNGSSGVLSVENSTFTFNVATTAAALGNSGWATVTASTFMSNTANGAGAVGNGKLLGGAGWMWIQDSAFLTNIANNNGGAIDNDGGEMHISSTAFTGNNASGGAAIYNNSTSSHIAPTLYITNSTFVSNSAGSGGGGALQNRTGQATIYDTTFSNNSSNGSGGAIRARGGTVITIRHSTLSGNSANNKGGALTSEGVHLYLENVTLSHNQALNGGGIYAEPSAGSSALITLTHASLISNTASGGGIFLLDTNNGNAQIAQVTLQNSLLAQNSAVDCAVQNGWEIVDASPGYNLDSDGTCVTDGVDNNIISADPNLGPLQDNGGDTQTHALLDGSPAIDAIADGVNGCGTLFTTDQRFATRPAALGCDIGSFEKSFTPLCFVESNGDDTTDYLSEDATALRQAIINANPGDTLKVAGTCAEVDDSELLDGEYAVIDLIQNLTLQGGYTVTAWLAAPNPTLYPTTLDAQGDGRVVRISNATITLENFQITNGATSSAANHGGGVYIFGGNADVTIRNSSIFSNTSLGWGGGLFAEFSNVNLQASQVYSNTAAALGGGLAHVESGTTTLAGVEVSNNQAGVSGGGLANNWEITFVLTDSVVSGNRANDGDGGGLALVNGGRAELVNSSVISNTASDRGGGLLNDLFSSIALTNTTLSHNQAVTDGGAMHNDGVLTIHDSTIISNTLTGANSDGGGITLGDSNAVFNPNAVITQTGTLTLAYNSAGRFGGGLYVVEGKVSLNQARILSNHAGDDGSALFQLGPEGGITITNSCIVFNDDTAVIHGGGPQINATANWWGAGDGPSGAGPGSGDSINSVGDINISGFLTSAPADCPAYQRTLTVNSSGNGSGSVVVEPNQATYDSGTVITLTANADSGSAFSGWSDDASGLTNPLTLTINVDSVVTAHFPLNQYPLTVATAGTGNGSVSSDPTGIDCGGDCSESYDHGTVITLTANASAGSTFAGWSGGCTNANGDCVVMLTAMTVVTANFTLNQYQLTVATAGAGSGSVSNNPAGIECGGDCSQNYDYGTAVTLTASADSGSSFGGWSGDLSGTTNPATITMDGDKFVTASFAEAPVITYTLTVNVIGSGVVTPSIGSFAAGSVVPITATADAGWSFAHWAGDLSGMENPTTITLDGDKVITATFLTATLSTTITLEVTPENPEAGEPITLTATLSIAAMDAAEVNACLAMGVVTFSANGNTLGERALDDLCQAVLTLSDGLLTDTYELSATYVGDAGYLPSTSTVSLAITEPEETERLLHMPLLQKFDPASIRGATDSVGEDNSSYIFLPVVTGP